MNLCFGQFFNSLILSAYFKGLIRSRGRYFRRFGPFSAIRSRIPIPIPNPDPVTDPDPHPDPEPDPDRDPGSGSRNLDRAIIFVGGVQSQRLALYFY